MENISLRIATKLSKRLHLGILASIYLIAIALTEALTVWIKPSIGLILYSVILLTLVLESAYNSEAAIRHLCLALTLIPLIRVVGFSIPQDELNPLSQYFLLCVALVVAISLVMHYLALQPGQIGLRFGGEISRNLAYFPVVLIALPIGFIEYQLVKLSSVNGWLAHFTTGLPNINPAPWVAATTFGDPIQSTFVFGILNLCLGFVEGMIFFGILLQVCKNLFGDWVSVFYAALLFSLLQSGQFSWEFGLYILVIGIIFGWVAIKTQMLYLVMLVNGFAKFVFLVAPALLADMQKMNTMISVIVPIEIASGGALSAILLIAFLVLKELTSATDLQSKWQTFARFLNIALAPLLISFFISIVFRIMALIR